MTNPDLGDQLASIVLEAATGIGEMAFDEAQAVVNDILPAMSVAASNGNASMLDELKAQMIGKAEISKIRASKKAIGTVISIAQAAVSAFGLGLEALVRVEDPTVPRDFALEVDEELMLLEDEEPV